MAVAMGVLAACGSPAHPDGRASTSPQSPPTATATISPSPTSTDGPVADVRKLLGDRAAGLLHGDRDAFLAPLDGAARSLRDRQGAFYEHVHGVPMASWASTLEPGTGQRLPGAGAESWSYSVVTVYALSGLTDEKAVLDQRVDVAKRPEGWRITDITDQQTHTEPWDIGTTTSVRAGRIVVLGIGASRQDMTTVEHQAAEAVPRVDAVWPGQWEHGAIVVVPADATEAATLSATDQIEPLAAVTTGGSGVDAAGHLYQWNRVVINPAAWKRMSDTGRLVVLTHEMTHLATGSLGSVPMWVSEGFADYVGWKRSGVGTDTIAEELRADVRKGHVPTDLPDEADFHSTHVDQAYEEAWLAARYIAFRYGESALIRVYRAMAARSGTSTADQDHVLRKVLGVSRSAFVHGWQGYVKAQLS
ncbi:MAG: hypothetical protein J2P24_15205 [Streptosporangiales bacterium]|nr:hypothetical protein [Streptosporangiales bacterium]